MAQDSCTRSLACAFTSLVTLFSLLTYFTCESHSVFISGLAQCTELCRQLRGECGKRQVPGAKVALQHNLGLGGAVVVGLYRLGFPNQRR